MARTLDEIAADLEALKKSVEFSFRQLDDSIRQVLGRPAVPNQPIQLFAEDGRHLDFDKLIDEVRSHTS